MRAMWARSSCRRAIRWPGSNTRWRYAMYRRTVLFATAFLTFAASRPDDIEFERRMIDAGASETVAVADINGDGRADIVSGEFWYEAPRWTKHRFREINFTNNYIDNFSD